MKAAYRIVLLIVIVAVSAIGVFALLPFAKEGTSWEDLPVFGAAIGILLFLAFLWWLAAGRSVRRSLVGWAILLLPLIAHTRIAASLVQARFEGERLAKAVRIENYREAPILWPGFDGPVGLRVSFELHHPAGIRALIQAPEIRMGPALVIPRDRLSASLTGGSGYLKNAYLEKPAGELTLLKPVLFQRVFENPAASRPIYKWDSAVNFSPSTKTEVSYFLLPGAIDYLPDRRRICLSSRSYGIDVCARGRDPGTGCVSPDTRLTTDPVYSSGEDLSALWMAAGAHDMIVDLSGPLTATLRSHSSLQAHPADWQAMQKRLEPAGLTKAGYRLCPPGRDSHSAFRTCYCRPG